MIDAQVHSIPNGAIVFDAALFDPAAAGTSHARYPDETWFDPAHWSTQGKSEARAGGRGGVAFVETPLGACVLRHYHRGGLAASVSADRYLWISAVRTRSFREFDLLARLTDCGLPVPAPIAARYIRESAGYRADLLMRRLTSVQTLAERLAAQSLDRTLAGRVGRTLARFHQTGVWHADLNAHNILVDEAEGVWLIDFDKGRLRKPALAWQKSNLARLRRSFDKLGARTDRAGFDVTFWHPLLAAYHATFTARAVADPETGAPR
ncbi:MAG TPA: 3-deoxy-D-manno-octulosonic acid kinase [Rhodanobacteraceae bacterium]|nr:3-deoxy-D-manno-octulosonic acid kinase [Rhodanobacteraceae bacterium]